MGGVRGIAIAHIGAGVSALALLLAACTSPGTTSPTGSSDGGSSSFADLLKGSGTSGAAQSAGEPGPAIVCPPVDIRPGTATMSFNAATSDPSVMGLRYQVAVSQTARECTTHGGMLALKVGVQGRVVVGPAGGPGSIEAPLRYALVQEGTTPKTLATKLHLIPITIPEGSPSVSFTHVEDDLKVPFPPGAEIETYVVYVGFDPLGARPRPAAKQPPQKKR